MYYPKRGKFDFKLYADGQLINEKKFEAEAKHTWIFSDIGEDAVLNAELCSLQPSFLHFFVSLQWLNKFNSFAEPGPISNNDFLCKHGGR